MRLVDADELLEILRIMQEVYFDRKIILGKVVEEVKRMPTIAPVRKGKWLKISPAGIYECSECGQNVMTSDIDVYRWCHGCGCRMEEPEDIPMEYFESGGR